MKVVLVVEDNPGIVEILLLIFMKRGMDVVSRIKGSAALKVLDTREEVEAVVTDMILPDMSGLELVEKIRKNPKTAGITVVVMSGYATEEMRGKALAAGADAFVKKPFSPQDILDALGE